MSKAPFISSTIHFLTLLCFSLIIHANSQFQYQEQIALIKLKHHWLNPYSLSHWTWSPLNYTHCSWPEVTCTSGSVTGLRIFGKQDIVGPIPPSISGLRNLSVLSLYNNSITGSFPNFLYNLSKLEVLNLSENYLSGSIPDDINRMVQLSVLDLSANEFNGKLPAGLGQLQKLTELHLQQNQFTGSLPSEVGNLTNLESLVLAYNRFSSSGIPSSFTKLKKLKRLWIYNTGLSGEIPEMMGEMTALEHLDLSSNNLQGKIPDGLMLLRNLRKLYLYNNSLSGEIPQVVEALRLDDIDISSNQLTSKIPEDFGKLRNLTFLGLFLNRLSGEIPESIGRLPCLRDFSVFSNNLSGIIPPDLGRYSKLEVFQVLSNRLTGRLPEYLCNGGSLVGVAASDNNLTGELPKSFDNCSSLNWVIVSNNALTGNVPLGIWRAPNLQYLMINDNHFTDVLPGNVSSNLTRLEISNNRFSGKIPAISGSWTNLRVFNASNNQFTGEIPQELTALPLLTTLLLDNNQLSGPLPMEIISWRSLAILNVSSNKLSGNIPKSLGSLPVLVVLDLSYNELSGPIPPEIGFLRLTYFNLSSNHLSGEIPYQFENSAYTSSFLNNPDLCTESLGLNLDVCNSKPQMTHKNTARTTAMMASLLVGLILMALYFSFATIRVQKKKRQESESLKWNFEAFQKVTFTASDVLSGLTESNLIGSGGSGRVYRVCLGQSGDFVAVKRIWNKSKIEQKLEKEFLSEVKILGTIKHSNIVKLLCCISSDESKLLVYEYLENSSLDKWLHSESRSTVSSGSINDAGTMAEHAALDWPKRLHIAVGAARGLCYMHHHSNPPIVHRDVKSSNILLDSDFNAKIADFGLARMLDNHGKHSTNAVFAGSFGYMAPESAHSIRVNEKFDVYSFGVVLLELATGLKANNCDENICLVDWANQHLREGRPIEDALDEQVMETESHLYEMRFVFMLGIKCTNKMPQDRPSMKDVLDILLKISNPVDCGLKIREYYVIQLQDSEEEKMSGSDGASMASPV